jgi:uncharacterized damage-inducible protein DinB
MTPKNEYPTLDTLYRHNLWANTQLFAFCAGLTPEQLETKIAGTYGTIWETLRHIASAEKSYWHRLVTGRPYVPPDNAPPQSMADLQTSIQASGEGLIALAPTVQPQETVDVDWQGSGTLRAVPKAVILTQAINHATEHRAQILTTLTQIGVDPPDLSGWTYFGARDTT